MPVTLFDSVTRFEEEGMVSELTACDAAGSPGPYVETWRLIGEQAFEWAQVAETGGEPVMGGTCRRTPCGGDRQRVVSAIPAGKSQAFHVTGRDGLGQKALQLFLAQVGLDALQPAEDDRCFIESSQISQRRGDKTMAPRLARPEIQAFAGEAHRILVAARDEMRGGDREQKLVAKRILGR